MVTSVDIINLSLDVSGLIRPFQSAVQYMPAQSRYIAPPPHGVGYPGQMSYGNYGYRNYQQYQPYRENEEYREREYGREGRGYGQYRRHHDD